LTERSVIKAHIRDKTTDSKAVSETFIMSRGRSHVTYNFGRGRKAKKYKQTKPYLEANVNLKPSQDITRGIAKF